MKKGLRIFLLAVSVQFTIIVIVYLNIGWTTRLTEKLLYIQKIHQPLSDDQRRLVDLTDFNYIINKQNLCRDSEVLLLVLISSAPRNVEKRATIRETWGQSDEEVKIVFVLGTVNNVLTASMQSEDERFSDIIQGNFQDSYENMTYKSTMSLKYAVTNCPRARYILKSDDDVFVNMPLMKNFLKNDLKNNNVDNVVYCNVNRGMVPIRDPKGPESKWFVSYKEWPEDKYPTYCSGFYALMTLHAAFSLYQVAQNTTFFWIDDVFLTGIVAKQIEDFKYVDMTQYSLVYKDKSFLMNDSSDDALFLFGYLNMGPKEVKKVWDYVRLRPVPKNIFSVH